MDRLPWPGDDRNQIPGADCASFEDVTLVDATEEAFLQFGPEPLPAPPAFDGRPDIDSALVDALRLADRNGPAHWPQVPLGRGDIDLAMVEALRSASVSEPEIPRA